jgi:hypothetical protein
VKLSFGTADKTKPVCLHCGRGLGFGRFTGARYCSDEHADIDQKCIETIMLQRLEKHRERMSRYGSMDLSTPKVTSASDILNPPAREGDTLAPKPVF